MQILLALFCLAIAMAAWRAWRSSPLYSLKSTAESAIVVLLGLALTIGFVLLIANHLPSQSPAVIVLCCVALISVITLGLVAAIIRITDGPAARIPPGVARDNKNRHRLYRWYLSTGFVLLLLLTWASLVSPADAEVLVALTAVGLGVGVSALGSLYIKARRTDYATTALQSNFWVHWLHTPGESDVWLGPDGILCGDKYTPWLASGSYLTGARAEVGPPASLVLTFKQFAGGGFAAPVTIRVPVPEGRESDLELLEERLRARCPKADVRCGVAGRVKS